MSDFLSQPLVIALLAALTLVIATLLFGFWLRRRRRWMVRAHSLHLPGASPELCTAIDDKRLELWQEWNENRTIDRADWIAMIRAMSEVVLNHAWPDEKNPEGKLNFDAVLTHSRDISDRLARLLNHPHMAVFRDLSIDDMRSWYQRLNAVARADLIRAARSSWVRNTISVFILALQTINPFSIGSRAASTLGAELAIRYFFSACFGIIAEETWQMTRKARQTGDKEPLTAAEAMVAIARSMETVSDDEFAFITSHLSGGSLDNRTCFALIKRLNKLDGNNSDLKKAQKRELSLDEWKALDSFARLNSADELGKLNAIRSLRSQQQEAAR